MRRTECQDTYKVNDGSLAITNNIGDTESGHLLEINACESTLALSCV